MTELILTPPTLMSTQAQALTAVPQPASMSDGTSYADEVSALTASARNPISVAVGLGAGAAGWYYSQRLPMLRKAKTSSQTTMAALATVAPTAIGITSAVIGHAAASWTLYSTAPRPALNDYMANTRHPISVGVAVGTFGASLYGLYKWRNPPGSKKQRWVLPLVGAIVASNIAGGTAAALVPKRDNTLDGLLEFGSLTQAVVSAAAIVGVYGGIRYAYALHGKKSRRGLADRATKSKVGGKKTYEVELFVVERGNAADDGTFDSVVRGSASAIAKAARALMKSSQAGMVAIVNDGEDVAYIKRGKPMAFHTVNFEPNKTLRRELERITQGSRKKTSRKGNLADCTPKLPTVAP